MGFGDTQILAVILQNDFLSMERPKAEQNKHTNMLIKLKWENDVWWGGTNMQLLLIGNIL